MTRDDAVAAAIAHARTSKKSVTVWRHTKQDRFLTVNDGDPPPKSADWQPLQTFVPSGGTVTPDFNALESAILKADLDQRLVMLIPGAKSLARTRGGPLPTDLPHAIQQALAAQGAFLSRSEVAALLGVE